MKHEPPRGGEWEWYTPPEIFQALGETFDLDPASPLNGTAWLHVPAARFLTARENGIAAPWQGFVWLNPPYGRDIGLWMERLRLHPGGGIALTFARTDTSWWHRHVAGAASRLLFIRGRVRFLGPGLKADAQGQRVFRTPAPSVMIGYGARAARALGRARRLGMLARPEPPTRSP